MSFEVDHAGNIITIVYTRRVRSEQIYTKSLSVGYAKLVGTTPTFITRNLKDILNLCRNITADNSDENYRLD